MIKKLLSFIAPMPSSSGVQHLREARSQQPEQQQGRYEIKFVAQRNEYDALVKWVHSHASNFFMPYAARWVNNVYFETYNYQSFNDNVIGLARRAKMRLRWYGQDTFDGAGQLEFKHRQGALGWKQNQAIPDISPLTQSWSLLFSQIEKNLEPDLRAQFYAFPCPVLYNTYHRDYFLSADHNVRLTLDRELSAVDQRYASQLVTNPKAMIPDYCVLELKFGRNDKDYVLDILRDIPVRRSRSSKFVTAMKAVTSAI